MGKKQKQFWACGKERRGVAVARRGRGLPPESGAANTRGTGEQRDWGGRRGRQTRTRRQTKKKEEEEEEGEEEKEEEEEEAEAEEEVQIEEVGDVGCRRKKKHRNMRQHKEEDKRDHLRSISALTLGSSRRDPAAAALSVSGSASVSVSLSVQRSILKVSRAHKRPMTPAATTMFPNALPKNLQLSTSWTQHS